MGRTPTGPELSPSRQWILRLFACRYMLRVYEEATQNSAEVHLRQTTSYTLARRFETFSENLQRDA